MEVLYPRGAAGIRTPYTAQHSTTQGQQLRGEAEVTLREEKKTKHSTHLHVKLHSEVKRRNNLIQVLFLQQHIHEK